jgi:pimeloyl-ACP methyl ester carboxylesterase
MNPTIVFLSGWGFPPQVWQPLIACLPSTYASITPNYPENFSYADLLLDLPEEFIVVGWSLGGNIALSLALQFPQRVKKVVTLACNPSFVQQVDWPGMLPAFFQKFAHLLQHDVAQTIRQFAYLAAFPQPRQKTAVATLMQAYFAEQDQDNALHYLNLLKQFSLHKKLPALTQDCLHIIGQQDKLLPENLATQLQQQHSAARVYVIEDAGHMLLQTHAQVIAEKLCEFFPC